MIWQLPWVWLGAAVVAVPVLVHALAHQRAAKLPFPTLRFVQVASVASVRRHQLTDIALMLIRAATLAAIVAALAAPFVITDARRQAIGGRVARAIVVDTSDSMLRRTPSGASALDAAMTIADAMSTESGQTGSPAVTIRTKDISEGVAAAARWLVDRSGLREVVIASDFQRGSLSRADVDQVPAGVGIQLKKIETLSAFPAFPASIQGRSRVQMTFASRASSTEAAWQITPFDSPAPLAGLRVLASPAEQATADAAVRAARELALPESRSDRPITIVLPSATNRDAIAATARALDLPWMFDVVASLAQDNLIVDAARTLPATAISTPPDSLGRSVTAVTTRDGAPLLHAAAGQDSSGNRSLILFSLAETGSVFTSALAAAAVRAVGGSSSPLELDPSVVPSAELDQWQRQPTVVAPPRGRDIDESDGRWLWAAALTMIGVESWLRRRKRDRAVAAGEGMYERVA